MGTNLIDKIINVNEDMLIKHPYSIFKELVNLIRESIIRNKGEKVVLSAYVGRNGRTFRGVLRDVYYRYDLKDCEVILHSVVEIPRKAEKYKDLIEKPYKNLRLLLLRDSVEWSAWLFKDK